MTSGRFQLPTFPLVLVGALALGTSACNGGSTAGCTQCAPMEGRYSLELDPGTNPPTCSGIPVTLPEGPLAVSRQDSDISAELDGLTLRGTLYQTNDFSLVGSRLGEDDGGTPGLDSASLSGRYVPGAGDGGVPKLVGDWQGNFSSTSTGGGTKRYSVTRSFTATRQ